MKAEQLDISGLDMEVKARVIREAQETTRNAIRTLKAQRELIDELISQQEQFLRDLQATTSSATNNG